MNVLGNTMGGIGSHVVFLQPCSTPKYAVGEVEGGLDLGNARKRWIQCGRRGGEEFIVTNGLARGETERRVSIAETIGSLAPFKFLEGADY